MNPPTRHEPLVGRLDGLFDEFLRLAVVWVNNAAPHIRVAVKEIDEARANAEFADGVLELTLPRKALVTGRKLEIS